MIEAPLEFRIKFKPRRMPPDQDWLIRRFPDRQSTFNIEYSGFFRLLSAVPQRKG
jgi:hypothetical protein